MQCMTRWGFKYNTKKTEKNMGYWLDLSILEKAPAMYLICMLSNCYRVEQV
jgi:hypothetical protein